MKAMLVYQAGIANVFKVDSLSQNPAQRNAKRLYQGDFRAASMFALGMEVAGAEVQTAFCNRAGDIAETNWDTAFDDAPFRNQIPVIGTVCIR